MMHRLISLLILGAATLSMGCDDAGVKTVPGEERTAPHAWTPSTPAHSPSPGLLPSSDASARNTRRVTVDQLRRSIPDLFGGQTWEVTRGRDTYQGFDALARTLGEADYNEVTESVTEPSPLFQKFMDDMSAQMCTKAVEHDLEETEPAARWVVRNPNDLDETLRFLRLKFHGIYVPADADSETDGLGDLRNLFSDIEADNNMESAWIGLCMAVLTAPEFLAY